MQISHETQNKQKEGHSWKLITSKRWIVALIGVLILLLVVSLAGYHQLHSAGVIKTTESSSILLKENGQTQKNKELARSTDEQASIPTIWPTSGAITSGFGWRNSPLESGNELHQGIDIANNMGIPVVATADGKVVKSGAAGGYGNMVQIDHGNGIETIYGHNSQIVVSVGQSVRKGQLISYIGSTGKSTGPHSHYEVRENGVAVNPFKYMVQYN
ncbi:MAG: Peptidase [Firmicutes bacterium]|nr:Peptidase [Bacillota bacterium]